MSLGLGNSIIIKSALSIGGFSFADSDAETYYNALVTANGGDIDSATLYSIDLDTLKQAIDTAFIDLKADGIYTNLVRWFPVIGGTGVTHAINAITAASELTYTGSPTHGAGGITTNGTTQYIDVNNVPFNDSNAYDYHMSSWNKNVTNNTTSAGSRDSATDSFWHRITSSVNLSGALAGVSINGTAISPNQMFTSRVLGENIDDRRVFENNTVLDGSVGTATAALPSSYSTIFSGWSNAGSVISLSAGDFLHGSVGYSLTDTEVSDYYTTVNTLQTTLGR